ncbi:hypothetical protein [Cupriavidus metallidurans]|uniref:hypothetical protein n=1 Tax=Cupriavidus metallidurans TaxID=119219 RepID=UPI001267A271|nr:hypothetical protein [Cupriavidus metallidurans]QGS32435.1 hypothetical protein FOB83_26755 [Cupriavidus metallidurans]
MAKGLFGSRRQDRTLWIAGVDCAGVPTISPHVSQTATRKFFTEPLLFANARLRRRKVVATTLPQREQIALLLFAFPEMLKTFLDRTELEIPKRCREFSLYAV